MNYSKSVFNWCIIIKLYEKKAGNIFATLDNQKAIMEVMELLDSHHSNINFTKEKSVTSFAFLDVNVKINTTGELESCVRRKRNKRELMLNLSAACPKLYTTCLISCLLHCDEINCLNKSLFDTEVEK